MNITQQPGKPSQKRSGSDSVWPLRGADGLTFAERKELKKERNNDR